MIENKRYIMNVTLEGAKSDIKRKISVNGSLSIDKFCIGVISSEY